MSENSVSTARAVRGQLRVLGCVVIGLLIAGLITEGRLTLKYFNLLTSVLTPHPWYILLGVLATPVVLGVGMLMGVTAWYFKVSIKQLEINDLNWSNATKLAIASGFCEEVLFRGVVQQGLGLPAASLIFGIMHYPKIRSVGYCVLTTFMGVCLGTLFYMSGNLWVPIIAHGLNNFIAFAARYQSELEGHRVGF